MVYPLKHDFIQWISRRLSQHLEKSSALASIWPHFVHPCSSLAHSPCLCRAEIHLNQSSPTSELPSYSENGSDASLLVSPLLVAGVVIGLVLFLSCVTIIVGSLRKDGRLRHPHQRRDTAYGKKLGKVKQFLALLISAAKGNKEFGCCAKDIKTKWVKNYEALIRGSFAVQ